MSDSCRACRIIIPPGGHAAGSAACLHRQLAALKAQIVADAAVARAADAFVASRAVSDADEEGAYDVLWNAVAARREALAPEKTDGQKGGA